MSLMRSRYLFLFTRLSFLICLLSIACATNRLTYHDESVSGFPIILPSISLMGHLVFQSSLEPVPMADLYIAGTSISAMTDSVGMFHLKNIPTGERQLMIELPGYFPVVLEIDVKSEIVEVPEKSLVAKDTCQTYDSRIEMLELQVADLRRKLSICSEEIILFANYLVGHQPECEIINPEAIDYRREDNKQGFIIHYSLRHPLILENRYLGYRMTVFLQKAVFREYQYKYSIDYDASVNYESFESADTKQIKFWNQMRRRVYEGSFRNFLVALVYNNLDQEGFVLYEPSQINMEGRALLGFSNQQSNWSILYDIQKMITRNDDGESCQLNFGGMIRVAFIMKGLGDKSGTEWGLTGDGQSSTIQLVNGPIQFNRYGHLLGYSQPRFSGYWQTTQISELLPLDYNPN